ncbi:MAG: hypothetical protein M3Q31_16460 [Actinomycetota bacterium]|nr:hypothetical protein [Actinomycetota bacterium]
MSSGRNANVVSLSFSASQLVGGGLAIARSNRPLERAGRNYRHTVIAMSITGLIAIATQGAVR